MDFRRFYGTEDAWFDEDQDLVEYEGKPTLTPPVVPQTYEQKEDKIPLIDF